MAELIDLEMNRGYKQDLLHSTKEQVDTNTGKIISKDNITVQRFKKSDEFIKVIVDNLNYVNEELDSLEKSVMWAVLSCINYKNIVFSPSLMSYCIHTANMSNRTYYRGLKGLIAKKVLFSLDDESMQEKYGVVGKKYYLVNPEVIGKGSFRDLVKLRIEIRKDFDFNTMEYKKEIVSHKLYSDNDFIKNSDKFAVQHVNKRVNEHGGTDTNIVLVDKEPTLFDSFKDEEKTSNITSVLEEVEVLETQADNKITNSNKDKKFDFMAQSLELTSKILDRIKDLEKQGRFEEAMSLHKKFEQYIDSISINAH